MREIAEAAGILSSFVNDVLADYRAAVAGAVSPREVLEQPDPGAAPAGAGGRV